MTQFNIGERFLRPILTLTNRVGQKVRSLSLRSPSLSEKATSEKSDTFCALAWNHLQIAPNGTVKMCCIASEDISDAGRPMSLYTDTYEQIWNSKYMRDARRGLASGEKISPCRRCFEEEASVGKSRRTTHNDIWLSSTDERTNLIDEARENDWRVKARPSFLQLNMGNLCNLACRMCSSQYSSKIEHDPVHNKWMPASYPDAVRWRGTSLHFGPRPFFGINYEGFYDYQIGGGQEPVRWTSGRGVIEFDMPAKANIVAMGLSLRVAKKPVQVKILINGAEVFAGLIGKRWSQRFEIARLGNQPSIRIEIESPSHRVGERRLGVGLLDAWVERDSTGQKPLANERALTRFPRNVGWWAEPDVMFEELLGEPEYLKCLIFQGGEPLLVKEFSHILDKIIQNGSANQITYEIVSNLTVVDDELLVKLAQLKKVSLGASVDGVGQILEYIRWPAVWKNIEQNLKKFAVLENVEISFNTAVQAYNLQNILALLEYCDSHAIDVATHFLVGPRHLNVAILPVKIRRNVIFALRKYRDDTNTRPNNRNSADYMIGFLEANIQIQYRDEFTNFVKFTNDLDKSRQQDFKTLFADTIVAFREDGLVWTDETVFA